MGKEREHAASFINLGRYRASVWSITSSGRSAGRPSGCCCEPAAALKKQAGTANLHVASAYKTITTMAPA